MNDKKEISLVVVVAAMLFLSLFIILPPYFRVFYPKEVTSNEEEGTVVVVCDKVISKEKKKITSTVLYENGEVTLNKVVFASYTPTEEELADDSGVVSEMTAEEEITYLKGLVGVEVDEQADKTIFKLTNDILENNDDEQLVNYFETKDVLISNYEADGYVCSVQ